jgi:hypothetical protein
MEGDMPVEGTAIASELASLGAAGLMGAMWLWERAGARTRERQLDEAHVRIVEDRVALGQLIEVVKQNTEALVRLSERLGERMSERMKGG